MGFLSLDGTFWVQLINFAIFFAVLSAVFLKPVGEGVRKRREYLDRLTSERDELQAEAKTLRESAEAERQAARRDAQATLLKRRGETSNETAEIAADYGRRSAERVAQAQAAAQAELDAAGASARERANELAGLVLEKTLAGASK